MSSADTPAAVIALAEERESARRRRDFVAADELRERISQLGYVVTDGAGGFQLAVRPLFEVHQSIRSLLASHPEVPAAPCTAVLVVDGWPLDVAACIASLVDHAPPETLVLALDCGNVDGAGLVLDQLASSNVIDLHISPTIEQVGWASAVTALIELSRSDVVVVHDLSTRFDGDALTPVLREFDDPSVVASGWRGVNANLNDEWRSFEDAPAGEVDAILGYLIAVRRDAALASPPDPKARFYRNADIEWSLAMRAAGGRLTVPDGPLPVHQERHHGYHDTDPEYRDRESRKTYDRLLRRFRSRPDILSPRS